MTTATDPPRSDLLVRFLRSLIVPILSILVSLIIGGIIIGVSGGNPLRGYEGLLQGAFGSQKAIVETIIKATPFIFAGLALTIGFRGGLFNIGVEGQLFVGSICAVIAGHWITMPTDWSPQLQTLVHVTIALAAGTLGGMIWAAIPGYLKARTGAHEVITTIMTNYIALRVINWSIGQKGPLRHPQNPLPETYRVEDSAKLPVFQLLDDGVWKDSRLHIGIFLAIIVIVLVWWLLWRTPLGFEIRTVGLNASAARYAGVRVERTIVLTMMLSGALAGLGGAVQVLGITGYFTTGFNVGLGFDSIAVAMLGGNHPVGVTLGAFLFGTMEAGTATMQLRTQVPRDIVVIVQGLILMFVAAPLIIRQLFQLREVPEAAEGVSISASWGGEG